MFSIYGISGPLFQGTLESLGRIPPVLRQRPVAVIRPVDAESDAASFVPDRQSAINAYQAMLPQTLERGPLYHANQIMRNRVITVNADDTLAQAWQTLLTHQIHQAPVLDAQDLLVGIFSERNLLLSLHVDLGKMQDVLVKRVRELMTTPVVAASPLTDIRRIVHVMLERNVEGVPIVNDVGSLIGFVSRSDILNAVVTDPPLSTWR